MTRREKILENVTHPGNGTNVFEDEQQVQDWLENKLEMAGHTAIQEVSPHRSKYKIDILLIHKDYGKIGLELKWLTGATDAATAHQQIVRQYAGKKYLGDRVDKWVFVPYYPLLESKYESNFELFRRGKMEFMQNFFHKYGIGTLNLHDGSPTFHFRFGNNSDYYIPAFSCGDNPVGDYVDIEKVEERIENRLYANKAV